MSQFTLHNAESAPDPVKAILSSSQSDFGFIPNLYAGLANAPQALMAYKSIAELFSKTSLNAHEQQVVQLSISVYHGCEFCVAAHSMIARNMVKLPSETVDALRECLPLADAKLAALRDFALAVVENRGWVVEHPAYASFLAAGYKKEQGLEVILGVTQKILSNYANHLMETPVNVEFSGEHWTRRSRANNDS